MLLLRTPTIATSAQLKTMSDSNPGLWGLVKSVLLPVDPHVLRSVTSEVRDDVQSTSWRMLLNRFEATLLLALIPGVLILFLVYLYDSQANFQYLQTVGIQYILGGGLLMVVALVKAVVWIVHSINSGKSVWGLDPRDSISKVIARTLVSLALVAVPVILMVRLSISFDVLALYFVTFCVLCSSFLAGLFGLLSTSIELRD